MYAHTFIVDSCVSRSDVVFQKVSDIDPPKMFLGVLYPRGCRGRPGRSKASPKAPKCSPKQYSGCPKIVNSGLGRTNTKATCNGEIENQTI